MKRSLFALALMCVSASSVPAMASEPLATFTVTTEVRADKDMEELAKSYMELAVVNQTHLYAAVASASNAAEFKKAMKDYEKSLPEVAEMLKLGHELMKDDDVLGALQTLFPKQMKELISTAKKAYANTDLTDDDADDIDVLKYMAKYWSPELDAHVRNLGGISL